MLITELIKLVTQEKSTYRRPTDPVISSAVLLSLDGTKLMTVSVVSICSIPNTIRSTIKNVCNDHSRWLIIIAKYKLLLLTGDGNMVLEQYFTSLTTIS